MKRALKILLLADSLYTLSAGMLGPIYAIFVLEKVKGDILTTSISWAIFTFVSGLSIVLLSRLAEKTKETELWVIAGYFLASLGYIGYIFISNVAGLFIVQILLGLGAAINKPAYDAVYSRHLEKEKFVTQWGLWEAKESMVGALAAVAGGLLVTFFSFNLLFILMASLSGLGGLIILIQPRELI